MREKSIFPPVQKRKKEANRLTKKGKGRKKWNHSATNEVGGKGKRDGVTFF